MAIWNFQGMAYMPSILVIWSSASFIVPYLISVLNGHVVPFVPYISDTGANPPESGVFGFMISVSAVLGAATMYTRYKIVEKQNDTFRFINNSFNILSLAIGLLGCIGMGIVATFQELAVPIVHDVGALITFICGVMYIFCQSLISYKSCPEWNSIGTCRIRMTISVVSIMAVFPMFVCASFVITKLKLHWTPEDQGYPYHLSSAICEWIVAFGFISYFLTFIKDFQGVSLRILTEIKDDFR
ncbi:DNA damage-regulated autophagy modulator protein 1 isoform X3 [Ascaphus truei]|uniref:DNA damage-regulated autophagy modulator protein 1 isoform X3 n=1 Tax=Ascaphus truei TaxID=8439 RepID=UPI003F5A6EBC